MRFCAPAWLKNTAGLARSVCIASSWAGLVVATKRQPANTRLYGMYDGSMKRVYLWANPHEQLAMLGCLHGAHQVLATVRATSELYATEVFQAALQSSRRACLFGRLRMLL
jgi:hypothetical protein